MENRVVGKGYGLWPCLLIYEDLVLMIMHENPHSDKTYSLE